VNAFEKRIRIQCQKHYLSKSILLPILVDHRSLEALLFIIQTDESPAVKKSAIITATAIYRKGLAVVFVVALNPNPPSHLSFDQFTKPTLLIQYRAESRVQMLWNDLNSLKLVSTHSQDNQQPTHFSHLISPYQLRKHKLIRGLLNSDNATLQTQAIKFMENLIVCYSPPDTMVTSSSLNTTDSTM